MNWSDEHYVKLYTRPTLTWRSWGWEARTTFLHLVKSVDHSGFIETGKMEPVDALVLQLDLPAAVVRPGLAELVASGTVELVDRAVLVTKFVEAQEAKKSEAQKKRDFRERTVARRRAQIIEVVRALVPSVEPSGTAMDPPAQPSPAQPSPLKTAGKKPPAPKHEKQPDSRHAPLVAVLATTFEAERSKALAFDGYQARAVTQLLAIAEPAEIEVRYRRALRHQGFPTVATPAELRKHWDHFATAGAQPKGSVIHNQSAWGPGDDFLAGLGGTP